MDVKQLTVIDKALSIRVSFPRNSRGINSLFRSPQGAGIPIPDPDPGPFLNRPEAIQDVRAGEPAILERRIKLPESFVDRNY
jgi:hypothetical protein